MPNTRIEGDTTIIGALTVTGGYAGPIDRTNLVLEPNQVHEIKNVEWRIWDNFGSLLPGGAVADDLGCVSGAFSTFIPHFRSLDLNALGAFQGYARALVTIPRDYIAGQPMKLAVFAGMLTSVASVSASVDFAAYRSAGFNVASADLVNTAPQSINTISPTDFFFDLITAALQPGYVLDVRMELSGNSVTASSHFAFANHVRLLYATRG